MFKRVRAELAPFLGFWQHTAMEVLCTLFDTINGVGEVLNRSEEKCLELSKLVAIVGTLSQAVRHWACMKSGTLSLDSTSSSSSSGDEDFASGQQFAQPDLHRGRRARGCIPQLSEAVHRVLHT